MMQWYEENKLLFDREIEGMKCIVPDTKYDFLSDGRMYWIITIHPVVCGKQSNLTFLAVYDSDYPHRKRGGSVKFYPMKPNYDEMMQMVNISEVFPKTIPHLLKDDFNQIYICSLPYPILSTPRTMRVEEIASASTCLRNVMRWVSVFQLGLIDQKTWTLFHRTGKYK